MTYGILPDGRWEFMFDNYAISTFSSCEEKYNFQFNHLLTPKMRSFTPTLGIWWHELLARFYKRMSTHHLMPKDEFLILAGQCWTELGMQAMEKESPRQFARFNGSKGAILMANRYWDSQAVNDFNNWKVIGTEIGFGQHREVKVGESDKVIVYYTGRIDLLILTGGRIVVVDHKTVDRVESGTALKYKPHGATAGYIFAADVMAKREKLDTKVDRCIINIGARQEPSDKPRNGKKPKPRFTRAFPHYSLQEMQKWQEQKVEQAERLRHCIQTGKYIMNEQTCHLYSGCSYREICNKPQGSRSAVIRADFKKAEPWVPYEIEE